MICPSGIEATASSRAFCSALNGGGFLRSRVRFTILLSFFDICFPRGDKADGVLVSNGVDHIQMAALRELEYLYYKGMRCFIVAHKRARFLL